MNWKISVWSLVVGALLLFCLPSCRKGAGKDYGGYQTKDFTGTWTLQARLYDHDGKGFDSSKDIAQMIPLSAHIEMQLNDDGTIKNLNNGTLVTSGNWYVTERHNSADRAQKLVLWPNIFGDDIQCDIENYSPTSLFIFYWTYDHRDSQGFEVFVRRGFWYVR